MYLLAAISTSDMAYAEAFYGLFQLFFCLVGLVLMYLGVSSYLWARKIENIPTSKIRSIAVGLVEVKGTPRPAGTFINPISKKSCAYYNIVISYLPGTSTGTRWVELFNESSPGKFYLEDDTGRILVQSESKNMGVMPRTEFEEEGKLSPEVIGFLNSRPETKKGLEAARGKRILVTEYCLDGSTELYVLGTAGQLEGASSEVHSENLVIRRGSSDKTFFMSGKSEKDSIRNSSLYAMVFMAVGFFIFALGAFFAFVTGLAIESLSLLSRGS